MSLRSRRPPSLSDLVRIPLRHKKKMVVWCVLALGGTYAALALMPRTYQSEAKVFVRLGRESVTLDPTATTGQTMSVQETRENQINSARDMLTSRTLLESVVAKVGAAAILGKPADGAPASPTREWVLRAKQLLKQVTFTPQVSPEEAAVEALSKAINVKSGRNSSVLAFVCSAADPHLAQQILQAFLEAYQEQHTVANRTPGSLDFFNQQTTHLKEQLDTALAALRDAKNRSGLVSLPEQQKALQDQLTELETSSLAADAALASAEASAESLRRVIGELPQHVPTTQTAGFANQASDTMQQEYFKLRLALRDLESRLGPAHPDVLDARKQLEHAELMIDAAVPDRTQSTVGLHPGRQALDLDLRREEALVASLRAKSGALREQLASLRERTRELNTNELPIVELERQVAMAEANYRTYAEHLEASPDRGRLDADRISNLNVVQAPTLVEKAASPKVPLVLAAGLLAAACGALALALAAELLTQAPRPIEDFESEHGLPVLGSIPRSNRQEVFVNN